MKRSVASTPVRLCSHPLFSDQRFTSFKVACDQGFTHYSEVSRNGNCFYTSLIVGLVFYDEDVNEGDINENKEIEDEKDTSKPRENKEIEEKNKADDLKRDVNEKSNSLRKEDFIKMPDLLVKLHALDVDEFVWEEWAETMANLLDERGDIREMCVSQMKKANNNDNKDKYNNKDNNYNNKDNNDRETFSALSVKDCEEERAQKNRKFLENCGGKKEFDELIDEQFDEQMRKGGDETSEDSTKNEEIVEDSVLCELPFDELTMFFKFVLSAELTEDERYSAFLTCSVKDYVAHNVQPMYKTTDVVDIEALACALGLKIVIYGMNGSVERVGKGNKTIGLLHAFDHFEPVFRIVQ